MPKVILIDDDGRKRVQTVNDDEDRTVQSDVERAEIRNILAKYEATGIIDHMRAVDLQFRDVTEFTDLSDAMQQAKAAENEFMALPSKLREVFDHDVTKWLDAAHDGFSDHQLSKLEGLGLVEAQEQPVEPVVDASTHEA